MRFQNCRSMRYAAAATLILVSPWPLSAVEVIVDNTDTGFSVTGTWATLSSGSGYYGIDCRTKSTSDNPPGTATWRPDLPAAGSYQVFVWYKSATTRPNNAHFTVQYDGGTADYYVDQTKNGSKWVLLGSHNFTAGTTGYVTLTSQAQTGKTIAADAVRFYRPDLTMAVSPAGGGATSPAIGGPVARNPGEVVSIQATPAYGYTFSQWTVSAGAPVANPTAANTTVTMDVSKTVTAVFAATPPEFRAVWADAFHAGFKSTAEIDSLVARTVAGNYNAIIAEVCAYQDRGSSGHGAYWNSAIVPKATDISGGIDPLAYLVEKAHASGIEVHAWLVAFRISNAWPPAGNAILSAHPEYTMVPNGSIGTMAPVGGAYVLDPGSPDAQEYLVSLVRELVTNYAIDGIHWDYIRYTQNDAGYPSDTAYARSGLARFREITGRTGVPSPTGDAQWDEFRRRTINEIIRRMRFEIPAIRSNPRQPLRHTAALICFGNAPSTWTSSSAYGLYQDWRRWMEQGWLDGACPMNYKREYATDQAQWYRNWVNAAIGWRYNRHMFLGQANYLNTMADSVTQMQYCHDQGGDGVVNYSYYSTADSNMDGTTENDWSWYPYVSANLFTKPAPLPAMPWRNPATATEGTLYGRVIDATTGQPADDVAVQVGTLPAVQTDGNGYYVVTMIPATAAGTGYSLTASQPGRTPVMYNNIVVVAGDVRSTDITVGPRIAMPVITRQPASLAVCLGADAQLSIEATGEGPLGYRWRRNGANLNDDAQYAGTTTSILTILNADADDTWSYSCAVSNVRGTVISDTASLSLKAATSITQQPIAISICAGGTATFAVAATGDGVIRYQWQKDGTPLADGQGCSGAASATLAVSNVDDADSASYRCLVTADCGTVISMEAMLTVRSTRITQQPASQDVHRGYRVMFTVAATGDGIPTYQWQKNGSDLIDDAHCYGATTPTLNISNVDVADAASYRCTVTMGCGPVTSNDAVLRVVPYLGDFDDDGDIDLADFTTFQSCFSGPNAPQRTTCGTEADFDGDADVDLSDFSYFQMCFNGPNRAPRSSCPGL